MSMDQYLAQYFGNAPASSATQEDVEKVAQVELFEKLAAANNVDLNTLSDEQLATLWNSTFAKEAEKKDDEKKEAPKDEKKDEPKKDEDDSKARFMAEIAEKKAAMDKFAEAAEMGRIMAHSYVAEMRKIAEAAQAEQEKKAAAEQLPIPELVKAASAVDQLAAKAALEKLSAAGWHPVEGATRINAVLTLGLPESTKTAAAVAAQDADAVTDIRSLEILQAAGYPVEWA